MFPLLSGYRTAAIGAVAIVALIAQPQRGNPAPRAVQNSAPAASPDGSKIAFMSDRDGDIEIYVSVQRAGKLEFTTLEPPVTCH